MPTDTPYQDEGDLLRDAALAELRHQLRTPVNHILGYSEMLMEDAGGAHGWRDPLGMIQSWAREILAALNSHLGERDRITRPELDALCDLIRRPVERIEAAVRNLAASQTLQNSQWRQDLERIGSAARSLKRMLSADSRSDAVASTAGTPHVEVKPASARILVVDDNAANRDLLSRRLERQGYAAEQACDGSEALDRMAAGQYDLVLLDIMMPVMDGFAVLAGMKQDRRLRTLPVVVISALDEMSSAVRALEMGAEDYLLKPFDPVLLRARIGALLEKKRLRDELTVQEKLASLGALTAGVAHEIKNPLNFVMNFAELSAGLVQEQRSLLASIQGKVDGRTWDEWNEINADLEQNIAKIREHGARADSIIGSMLAHSRGQQGERRPIDINALAREYVNLAFHGMRAQDPTLQSAIEADYDPAAGVVNVIPQDLSRVFLNVAGNAFYAVRKKAQAKPAGYEPTVWVRTCNLGERVEVRIRDNGVGIPKEILERVFDPFFTTKPAGEGTGLGLSMCHDIVVQEHQGEIRVESADGEFTEFVITIPRNPAEHA